MTGFPMTDETTVALRKATEWHLISLLFQCPSESWRERLAGLAGDVAEPELQIAVRAALEHSTESLYCTTLGPGGPAAPREVSYRDTLQPGQFLAQLTELYANFAFHPDLSEPPDHVAYETAFVGFLYLKEAYALMSGLTEQAEVCRTAVPMFLENHLSHLAQPLATALEFSGIDYLAKAAQSLAARTGPPRHKSGESAGLFQIIEEECASPCADEAEPCGERHVV